MDIVNVMVNISVKFTMWVRGGVVGEEQPLPPS
jgi:hypothetical protein